MLDGDEIHGVLCAQCGGSVEWRNGRPYCDWDGAAGVVAESVFLVSRKDNFDDSYASVDD